MKRIDILVFVILCLFVAGGIVGEFVWVFLLVGCIGFTAMQRREEVKNERHRVSSADIFMLIICISELLSALFSEYRSNSVKATSPILLAVFFWFFFRMYLRGRNQRKYFNIGMTGLSFVLSAITIGTYISFRKEFAMFEGVNLLEFKQSFSPLGIPVNDWVAFLLCVFPFPFISALDISSRRVLVLFMAVSAFSFAAIALCLSRGAFVALAVFYLLFIAFSLLSSTKSFRMVMIVTLTSVIAGFGMCIPALDEIGTTLAMTKTSTQNRSTEGRVKQLEDGCALWKDRPLTGVGGGNFNIVYDSRIQDKKGSSVRAASTYLLMLVEKGALGVVAYGGLILSIMVIGIMNLRRRQTDPVYLSGFAMMCVRGLFFSSFFFSRFVLALVMLLALFTINENGTDKKGAESFFYVAGLFSAAVALAFVASASRLRLAERNNQEAVMKAVSKPKESMNRLDKAMSMDKRNPVYPFNLSLLLAEQGCFSVKDLLSNELKEVPDSVFSMLEKAVLLSSGEPVFLLNLAIANSLRGNLDVAISQLEPLVEQDYCWSPVRIVYGMLLENKGNRERAKEAYVRAVMQTPIVLESRFFRDLVVRDEAIANDVKESAFRKTMDAYERNPSPLLEASLGEQAFMAGKKEAALWLQDALSRQPSMNRPWLFLGRLADTDGRKEDALTCFEKSVVLDDKDALSQFFLAVHKESSLFHVERYRDMLSYEIRGDVSYRWKADIMPSYLIISGLEEYCNFDLVEQINGMQKEANVRVMTDVLHDLLGCENMPLGDLSARIASALVDTRCEAGLLDVYPERLRVMLDRTDNLHFLEMCIALGMTFKEHSAVSMDSFYDSFCERVRQFRYRDGVMSKFSDRIFYFSEWIRQAEAYGILGEFTQRYGEEYGQSFSYLSDHLMFLPQIGREPTAREDILAMERWMTDSGPFYRILPDRVTDQFAKDIIHHGDILAIVSDRKGEDVSKAGIVFKQGEELKFIYASMKEKKVVIDNFPPKEEAQKGIRLFRIY